MINCDLNTIKSHAVNEAMRTFKGKARSIRLNEDNKSAIIRWGPDYRVKTKDQAINMVNSNITRVKKWSKKRYNREFNDWVKIDGQDNNRIALKFSFPSDLEKAYTLQMAKEGNEEAIARIEKNPGKYGTNIQDPAILGDIKYFQTTASINRKRLDGLDNLVKNFLKKSGLENEIQLVDFKTYAEKYKVKFGKELDFVAFADIANNAIAFNQGKTDGTSLLEEAMHFVTHYLWNTDRFKTLRETRNEQGVRWLETTKEWNTYRDQYTELYRDVAGMEDWRTMLDQEIITKILTNFVYDVYSGRIKDYSNLSPFKRRIRRLLDWISRLFGRKNSAGEFLLDFPKEVAAITSSIGNEFLSKNLSLASSSINVINNDTKTTFIKTESIDTLLKDLSKDIIHRLITYKKKISLDARQQYNKLLKATKAEIIKKWGVTSYDNLVKRLDYLLEKRDAKILEDIEITELEELQKLEDLIGRDIENKKIAEKIKDIQTDIKAVNNLIEAKQYQNAIKLFVLGIPYIDVNGVQMFRPSILQETRELISKIDEASETYKGLTQPVYPLAMKAIEFYDIFFPVLTELSTLLSKPTKDPIFNAFSTQERTDLMEAIKEGAELFSTLDLKTRALWKNLVEEELIRFANSDEAGDLIFDDFTEEEIKDLAHGVQFDVNYLERIFSVHTDMSPYQIAASIKMLYSITNNVKRKVQEKMLSFVQTVMDNKDSLMKNKTIVNMMNERGLSSVEQLIHEFDENNKTTGNIINDVNIGTFKKAREEAMTSILNKLENFIKSTYSVPTNFKIPRGTSPEEIRERNRYIYEYSNELLSEEEKDLEINPITNHYKYLWSRWTKENTEKLPNIDAIVAERKRELTATQFEEWEHENFYNYQDSLGAIVKVPTGELVKPAKKYKNHDFEKLRAIPEFMVIYNQYFDLKEEADENLPEEITSSYDFRFRMPQIELSTFDAAYEAARWHTEGKTIGARFRRLRQTLGFKIKSIWTPTASDELYRTDYVINENLPAIATPPIRYIKPLDDSSLMSKDVIGSMMLYYGMAQNYHDVMATMPLFNAYLESAKTQKFSSKKMSPASFIRNLKSGEKGTLHQNIIREGSSNTYAVMKHFMNSMIYGHKKQKFDEKLIPLLNVKVDITKLNESIAKWKRDVNLKANYPAMIAGWFSGSKETVLEAAAGRNFDKKNILWAFNIYRKYMPEMVKDYQSPIKTNKVSALNQMFHVIDSNHDHFQNLDKKRFARTIHALTNYGGWRYGDHGLRTRAALAIMHNYRYIDGRWYTKEKWLLARDEFGILKNTEETWEQNKDNNFFNKVSFVNGKLEFSPEIKSTTINFIMNKIKIVGRDISTQKSDLDEAYIDHTLIGSWVMMHKAFLRLGIFRRFKRRHRNYVTGKWEEGSWNFLGALLRREISAKSLLSRREDLTPEQREGSRRAALDLAWLSATFLMAWAILNAIDSDDEKEDARLATIAYVAVRNYQEASAFLWVEDFSALVLRPVAGVDALAELQNLVPGTKNDIWKNRDLRSGPYETIKQKTLIKMLPGIRGAYETLPFNTPLTNAETALPLKRSTIQGRVIGDVVPTSPLDWLMDLPADADR